MQSDCSTRLLEVKNESGLQVVLVLESPAGPNVPCKKNERYFRSRSALLLLLDLCNVYARSPVLQACIIPQRTSRTSGCHPIFVFDLVEFRISFEVIAKLQPIVPSCGTETERLVSSPSRANHHVGESHPNFAKESSQAAFLLSNPKSVQISVSHFEQQPQRAATQSRYAASVFELHGILHAVSVNRNAIVKAESRQRIVLGQMRGS